MYPFCLIKKSVPFSYCLMGPVYAWSFRATEGAMSVYLDKGCVHVCVCCLAKSTADINIFCSFLPYL